MNISNAINFSLAKVTGTKEKVPLIAFGVAILGMAYAVLYNLIYAIFGYTRVFQGIYAFLNVLSIIAFVVLAIYLILLFVKQKKVLHLLAGIFLFFSLVLGKMLLTNLCWLVFAVCIAYSAFTGEDEDLKTVAKLALLLVVVGVAMNFLAVVLWRLPRFIYGLYFVILCAVKAVSYVMLLALYLHEAESAGGAVSVVTDLIAKIKSGKDAETSASAAPAAPATPVAPVYTPENTAPVQPVQNTAVPPAKEVYENTAPAVQNAHTGNYQYKTVAGPIGLTINKNDNYGDGVMQYASVIQRESFDGWEFDSIHEIPVTKNNGCIAALMGRPTTTISFNMLIFRREI